MLVTLVIILLLIGAAVVGSIYSNFLVFYSNFSESENYHRAYYTSISALERGELVVKQRSPGYVGSGGFKMGTGMGSTNNPNGGLDSGLTGFSYLGDNPEISTVFWTVESKTTRIPAPGEGNIEGMLSAGDSSGYNMMDYENAENFLLYIDNSGDDPYKKVECSSGGVINNSDCSASKPDKITGVIRLPKLLEEKGFGTLDESKALILQDRGTNIPKDDPIVDWQIRGNYTDGNPNTVPFTVFSTSKTTMNNGVDSNYDSVFREKDINKTLNFEFAAAKSPLNNNKTSSKKGQNLTGLTVVSQKANDISNKNFYNIFNDYTFSNVQLRFSLLNLLKGTTGTANNPESHIYPFLEYYVDFDNKEVPDRYYTITAEGNYADFQVNTIVKKPTTKETILGSFTSIF